jgi:hypothetical protein
MRQRPDYEDRLLIPEEYDEDYGELTAIAGAILEISPLLLPVAADVVRACVKTEPVVTMGELDSVMRVYRALQSDFMYLAQEIFSPEKGKNKQRIYMEKGCFGSMDEQLAFGTLAYGELRMEWICWTEFVQKILAQRISSFRRFSIQKIGRRSKTFWFPAI